MTEPESAAQDIPEEALRAARETFVVVGRLRRRLAALAGDSGLTPPQTSALVRLSKAATTPTIGELAGAEQVTHQAMAKTVALLEQAGLVARTPDPADGRRQLLSLTEVGRTRAQGERNARQEWLARALAERGTPEQVRAVVVAMELLGEVSDSF